MAYTALYRKFRPQNFRDVVGQEHIIKALTNQIKSTRISHSYLFCGTRGTGKTSSAKIFARAINCENPIEGEPCNECASCINVLENASSNVMEIDAASNSGVSDAREIVENVKYTPATGHYKVYIIDEVHMLSKEAFNALLKTIEEPPNYVVFILATTDPDKIPITILSRCQRHDFKRIKSDSMLETIKTYAEKESINISEEALRYIVSLSDGAMRDVLSILDQCTGLYMNEEINLKKVQELLGAVDMEIFTIWVDCLHKFNGAKLLDVIAELVSYGRDINQFTIDLLKYLRNMLYIKTAGTQEINLDLPIDKYEIIKNQSSEIEIEMIIKYINTFASFQGQLRNATNPSILLETTVIKLCNPHVTASAENNENLLERISKLETMLEDGELENVLTEMISHKGISFKNNKIPEKEVDETINTSNNSKVSDISNNKIDAQSEQVKKEEVSDGEIPEIARKIQKEWKTLTSNYIKNSKQNFVTQALSTSSFEYIEGKLAYIYFENPVVVKFMQDKQRDFLDELIKNAYNVDIRLELKANSDKKNLKKKNDASSNTNKEREKIPKDYFKFDQIEEE